MSKPKKFTRGRQIKSLDTLNRRLKNDGWVIIRFGGFIVKEKPMHFGWVISFPFRTILQYLELGRIFAAKRVFRSIKQVENEFFPNGEHYDEYEPDDWQY